MSRFEAWLDVMPGETRGIVARDGRFERLIIHRDDDVPNHRLGAHVAARVTGVDVSLGGAFVDVGGGPPFAFLPLKRDHRLTEGARIEAVVTVEPRGGKGPAIRLIGPAEGEPRLLTPGPDMNEILGRLAPDTTPIQGVAAIQAARDAEEEALAEGAVFAEQGVDLAVERTRAMVAVDVDHAGARGRDPKRDRARANLFAMEQAARLIRLKGWGGLVSIDLAGTGHDGEALTKAARGVFAPDGDVVIGPVTRFGVMQLALPWTRTPVEERLNGAAGRRPTLATRALDVVRRLNQAALADRTVPVFVARCAPEEAAIAAPLAARFGPRAVVRADSAVAPGRAEIEEA